MSKIDLTPLANYLIDEDPATIIENLDNACINLSVKVIEHPDDHCFGDVRDQVYFMKVIRDFINAASK